MAQSQVVTACEKVWEAYKHDCSGFVNAVARELLVFMPGSTGLADWMTWMISNWLPGSTSKFQSIGSGRLAIVKAVEQADLGHLIIAGLTHDEINSARRIPEKFTEHGHVVVVTPGIGKTGWPRGYWGTLGGLGCKDESLSATFRHGLKEKVHYFSIDKSTFTRL
jgi:hypothetical protein